MQSNLFWMSSQRKIPFDCLRLSEQTFDATIELFASFIRDPIEVEHLFDLDREVHRFCFRFIHHQLSLKSEGFTLPNTLALAV